MTQWQALHGLNPEVFLGMRKNLHTKKWVNKMSKKACQKVTVGSSLHGSALADKERKERTSVSRGGACLGDTDVTTAQTMPTTSCGADLTLPTYTQGHCTKKNPPDPVRRLANSKAGNLRPDVCIYLSIYFLVRCPVFFLFRVMRITHVCSHASDWLANILYKGRDN